MKRKRFFGLDLIRAIAFLFIILVHSFMNSGFNTSELKGFQMFSLLMIRCIAFTGVLIFILITGYCKSNKELTKSHYSSITKILIMYLVISIITIFFEIYYLKLDIPLYQYIIGIFNFTTISYAWYIEMYIGLFLLIPFLNTLYKNLLTKKNKQILIITLIFITSIPSTFSSLSIENNSLDIFPNWWGYMYPILLYYIGSYIKEYKIKINKVINMLMILVLVFLQAFVMYFYCQGKALYTGKIFISENNFPSIVLATLIFILFYDINTHSKLLSKIIYYISYASLGGYLISYCYDIIIYRTINLSRENPFYFSLCTFMLTPIIFLISTLSSLIINKLINLIHKLIIKLHENHKIKVSNKELY